MQPDPNQTASTPASVQVGGQMAHGFATQQVMVTGQKSSLPIIVGVIFCLAQGLGILGGLAMVFGGALIGGIGGEEAAAAAGIVAGIGVLILLLSGTGIWAGVLIAQRKKMGVKIAWGLIAAGTILSILGSVLGETSIDFVGLGCNGICALFVGLPLMISSASQHME
tara:strand:- start:32 stop:532 length:501 start_codon:yes stop_codon:yes gene_type:complete